MLRRPAASAGVRAAAATLTCFPPHLQAFEEILPQVTEALTRDGHLPDGAKLERQGVLPIEGCYRTAAPAAGDQQSAGQYGFYLVAPFTHVSAAASQVLPVLHSTLGSQPSFCKPLTTTLPTMQAGLQHVRRIGVWSTNKHTYPHVEVFRYRLYN